jgi:carbon starvation protein CstA
MFTLIVLAIFAYYIIATLPIDKIIGKIYPVLGLLLLLSAIVSRLGCLCMESHSELTLTNMHPKDLPTTPIFLTILRCFIWISCNPITNNR